MHIQVSDVNEYAPVFKEKSYKATVVEGKQYESVLRVEAVDADCSPQFSQICSYEIVTPDAPFAVDKDGENGRASFPYRGGQSGQTAPSKPVGFKPKLCTSVNHRLETLLVLVRWGRYDKMPEAGRLKQQESPRSRCRPIQSPVRGCFPAYRRPAPFSQTEHLGLFL